MQCKWKKTQSMESSDDNYTIKTPNIRPISRNQFTFFSIQINWPHTLDNT